MKLCYDVHKVKFNRKIFSKQSDSVQYIKTDTVQVIFLAGFLELTEKQQSYNKKVFEFFLYVMAQWSRTYFLNIKNCKI